jgi:hypothetical protein
VSRLCLRLLEAAAVALASLWAVAVRAVFALRQRAPNEFSEPVAHDPHGGGVTSE